MPGFFSSGAASEEPLPGTRRVLRNGYPLSLALLNAVALFVFFVCLAVFDQLLLAVLVLVLYIAFLLVRGVGQGATSIHDVNRSDAKKTALGHALQTVSVLIVIFVVVPDSAPTGLSLGLAMVSAMAIFAATAFFLPYVYVEGTAGAEPDRETLRKNR